jgi:hypothetical protein
LSPEYPVKIDLSKVNYLVSIELTQEKIRFTMDNKLEKICSDILSKNVMDPLNIDESPLDLYLYAKSNLTHENMMTVLKCYFDRSNNDVFDFDRKSIHGIELMKIYSKFIHVSTWFGFRELHGDEPPCLYLQIIQDQYVQDDGLKMVIEEIFESMLKVAKIDNRNDIYIFRLCEYMFFIGLDPRYYIDQILDRYIEEVGSVEKLIMHLVYNASRMDVNRLMNYVIDRYDFVFTRQFSVKLALMNRDL